MSNFLGTVELTKDFSFAGIHLARDEQPRLVVASPRLRAGRAQAKYENPCDGFRLVRNEKVFPISWKYRKIDDRRKKRLFDIELIRSNDDRTAGQTMNEPCTRAPFRRARNLFIDPGRVEPAPWLAPVCADLSPDIIS